MILNISKEMIIGNEDKTKILPESIKRSNLSGEKIWFFQTFLTLAEYMHCISD